MEEKKETRINKEEMMTIDINKEQRVDIKWIGW